MNFKPTMDDVAIIELPRTFMLALDLYNARDWSGAERLCRLILQRSPDHVDTYHLLGAMQLQGERFEEAKASLLEAKRLQPTNPAVIHKLGIVYSHLGLTDDAMACFNAALALDGTLVEIYAARGALHEALGQDEAALKDFATAIELRPDFVLGHLLMGNRLAMTGQAAQALHCYDRAIALAPGFADAWHAKGNAQRELQQFDDALQSYSQALAALPNHWPALSSQADLLYELGRQEPALTALDKVIRLKPDHQDALLRRGGLYYARSELEKAQADFARVVQLNPDNFAAYLNIGNIHFRMTRYPQAVGNYAKAIGLDPNSAEAHLYHSRALAAAGELDKAQAAIEHALALAPNMASAVSNQAALWMLGRQYDAAMQGYRRAIELQPDLVQAHSSLLYCMTLTSTPGELIREEAIQWDRQHAEPLTAQRYRHERTAAAVTKSKRLRVGYVSPDFRNHSVAKFMAPILAHHDDRQIEVFCYACHPVQDEMTKALSKKVKHWVDASAMSSEALARRIHDDAIDVLVDLAGHTADNQLLCFARKPAPVQITYLGYPGTTGLQAMDYRITDAYADPAGAESHYTEALLRLPHSLWCFQPNPNMPAVKSLPALTRGHLTLGSFNAFNKLDARSLELWAKLMQAVPTAHLVVATVPEGQCRADFLRDMAARGVASDRIDLLGSMKSDAFWQALANVDISLDPVAVNGATTTCESMWLGVPVLSRVGNRFLERAGLSLLTTAGLDEFACDSDERCVELLQSLANDLPRLASLRASLRDRLRKTPIIEAKPYTRALEQVYKEAWDRWANSKAPD